MHMILTLVCQMRMLLFFTRSPCFFFSFFNQFVNMFLSDLLLLPEFIPSSSFTFFIYNLLSKRMCSFPFCKIWLCLHITSLRSPDTINLMQSLDKPWSQRYLVILFDGDDVYFFKNLITLKGHIYFCWILIPVTWIIYEPFETWRGHIYLSRTSSWYNR